MLVVVDANNPSAIDKALNKIREDEIIKCKCQYFLAEKIVKMLIKL